jgi:hypothetical protein
MQEALIGGEKKCWVEIATAAPFCICAVNATDKLTKMEKFTVQTEQHI